MQIKSWQAAFLGGIINFIIPLALFFISFSCTGACDGAPYGVLIASAIAVPAAIIMIPYFYLKSEKPKLKILGAMLCIVFGTIMLSFVNLLLLGVVSTQVIYVLPLILSGILLLLSGFLFFGKENKTDNKKMVLVILVPLLIVIFSRSITIELFSFGLDNNPSVRECQIRSIPLKIIVGITEYFFQNKSYSLDSVCYNEAAKKNLDAEMCKKISTENDFGKSTKRECLLFVASRKNDINICPEADSYCYSIVVEYNNDLNLCEKTGDGADNCYQVIATNLRNPYLCEKISDKSLYRESESGYCSYMYKFCSLNCYNSQNSAIEQKCDPYKVNSATETKFLFDNEIIAVSETLKNNDIKIFCDTIDTENKSR